MRVALIFRGINIRHKSGQFHSALAAVDNWQNMIINDLKSKNIDFDVIFITYPSDILNSLVEKMNAIEVTTEGYSSQAENMRSVSDYIVKNKDKYDKFVVMRFDFIYKMPITEWPHFNSPGITLPNKDVTYEKTKYYSDYFFMLSNDSADLFKQSVYQVRSLPHEVGAWLTHNNISFNVMCDGYYYDHRDHPVYEHI